MRSFQLLGRQLPRRVGGGGRSRGRAGATPGGGERRWVAILRPDVVASVVRISTSLLRLRPSNSSSSPPIPNPLLLFAVCFFFAPCRRRLALLRRPSCILTPASLALLEKKNTYASTDRCRCRNSRRRPPARLHEAAVGNPRVDAPMGPLEFRHFHAAVVLLMKAVDLLCRTWSARLVDLEVFFFVGGALAGGVRYLSGSRT